MGTSWVAVSINNITTRASREMTSRKNIKIFHFNGMNVAKHWHVAGEVVVVILRHWIGVVEITSNERCNQYVQSLKILCCGSVTDVATWALIRDMSNT